MCRPPPLFPLLPPWQQLSADRRGDVCGGIRKRRGSGSGRKLCQEVGSLVRWMEGDSSGWVLCPAAVRTPDLPLLSTWQRGWLTVSLTAPPVMSVMPGDTGSHVFWADLEQLKHFFFLFSCWKKGNEGHPISSCFQLFLFHTVQQTSEQPAVTRTKLPGRFLCSSKRFYRKKMSLDIKSKPKSVFSFFIFLFSFSFLI